MDRVNKIIFDTQTPPDKNGVFDGDSFNDLEFKSWLNTVSTYPKIKLRSLNKKSLISKIKKMSKDNCSIVSIKSISTITIEITFKRMKWV